MTFADRFVAPSFVLLWATGFIGARYAMPWAEPLTFLALRFGIALVILGVLMLVLGARRLSPKATGHAVVVGMLMHGLYLGTVFWAIRHGMPAGIAALVAGLQPLLTAILAGVLLREIILPRHWVGLAAGLAGVVLVLWPKLGISNAGVTPQTLIACSVSLASICAGTIWQKRFATGGDMVTGAFWQYFGALVLTTAGAFAFETREVTVNGELIFALAWLVLVLSIGATFLLMRLIRQGSASKVASLFYLVPAVTAVIAWGLFDETLTALQVAGMALATFGVGLATVQFGTRARASR
ncbi:DMT family transporter [Corticibacterium sp. UT-5YL-CI-8]|nr:DMT family transporter [Tianweitania sp. UT-5YL-CI-8]